MKKILLAAATIGLIAVPSIAMAHRGNNNVNQPADKPQHSEATEVAAAELHEKTQDSQNVKSTTQANSTTQSEVKIEQEGTLPMGSITITQAQTLAEAAHTGSKVVKIEVETEHGTVLFSVRFADGTKIDLDMKGNIVKQEVKKSESKEHSTTPEMEKEHSSDQ